MQGIYGSLLTKEKKMAVIGLGYVGLPIALSFSKHFRVVGYDINPHRIKMMQKGIDPSSELTKNDFLDRDIVFTDSIEILGTADFYIVAVPTAVDENNIPDLSALTLASVTIGKVLKKGGYVVFESTVYPGCTEEDCLPLIESESGLTMGDDFKLGYSPERINPGDKTRTIENIVKIVAASDNQALREIAKVYGTIVKAGVYEAGSIKVAEAAKIIENTQRDVNIALMNELSLMFDKMKINTLEVLNAASTKWNFLPFKPGLVGGHCIGVDPYYLTHKASTLGYHSKIISAGRAINDEMGRYVAKKIVQHIIQHCPNVKSASVLIMGATFKENVADIRNSKVADVVKSLREFFLEVDVFDPMADPAALFKEYGIILIDEIKKIYDAVIITVAHDQFKVHDDVYFSKITHTGSLIADIKALYFKKITSRKYWTL